MILEQELHDGKTTLESEELVVKNIGLETMHECLKHEVWFLHIDDDLSNRLLRALS